ncbi:MAG: S26 family signal peptidase [Methanothrix sp.]|jgi:signal peptidase|uniref:S26 family signal peptidase n=1 Tax=Methanothrix sp. TaxID=90426 RepID=UPI00247D7B60|nr:S26 family signal peptidase [Methanothrix sp.]
MKLSNTLAGLPSFVRDIIFVVVVVGGVSLVSQALLGLWTPMVAVESGSMVPNMNIGDIIIVQGISRTDVITWEEGEAKGYRSFNNPGDVILYRPYGKKKLGVLDIIPGILGIGSGGDKATPIIHRAMRWVEKGEPMWEGGPPAPFAGYITKGDHNEVIDQMAGRILGVPNYSYIREHPERFRETADGILVDRETGLVIYSQGNTSYVTDGISYLTPVRKEWVIGVARYRIPYVGYIRLIPEMIVDWIRGVI